MPFKYRKKPVEIEAMQFDGTALNAKDIYEWSNGSAWIDKTATQLGERHVMRVETLEGLMTAEMGDYIVKGIEGEFYSVKESIFDASYELL